MSEKISLGFITTDQSERAERRDAAENRTRILDAARALFDAHGVARVNMADIAQEAGVGKGTLYRRFANKGELCYSLMDEHLMNFQDKMLAIMNEMTQEGQPKLAQLSVFLGALVQFTEDHMPLLCEVQQNRLQISEHNLQLPHFWQYMTIQGLLVSAEQANEFRPGIDISLLPDMLLAPLSADFYQFLRQVKGYTLEDISSGLQNIVQGLER